MGQYCQANAEVKANTGFSGNYGSSSESNPTLTEVNYFITETEAEINALFASIGIGTVTNSNLSSICTKYAALGTAGQILKRFGAADDQARADWYVNEYNNWKTQFLSNKAYQQMILNLQGTIGGAVGSAFTNGFVSTQSTNYPVYGVDAFQI